MIGGTLATLCFTVLVGNIIAQVQQLTETEIQILRDNGITVIDTDQDTWTLEHPGIPEHGFPGGWGNNPNMASVQNHSFPIPKIASVQETKGCVRLGPVGMSISGVPFFNPYTAQGQNAVDGDCQETFDDCSGHADAQEIYHYHKLPACIYSHRPNQFLGVAFDGFPIYGPMEETGYNMTSADLDQCHGHWHQGRYKYRVTRDFPYVLGCYNGVASQRLPLPGRGNRPPRMKREYNQNSNSENIRSKRQQGNNRLCMIEESPDWRSMTCYAFCETPSSGSYDNCEPPSGTGSTQSSKPSESGTTFRPDITTISASTRIRLSSIFSFLLPLFIFMYWV